MYVELESIYNIFSVYFIGGYRITSTHLDIEQLTVYKHYIEELTDKNIFYLTDNTPINYSRLYTTANNFKISVNLYANKQDFIKDNSNHIMLFDHDNALIKYIYLINRNSLKNVAHKVIYIRDKEYDIDYSHIYMSMVRGPPLFERNTYIDTSFRQIISNINKLSYSTAMPSIEDIKGHYPHIHVCKYLKTDFIYFTNNKNILGFKDLTLSKEYIIEYVLEFNVLVCSIHTYIDNTKYTKIDVLTNIYHTLENLINSIFNYSILRETYNSKSIFSKINQIYVTTETDDNKNLVNDIVYVSYLQ